MPETTPPPATGDRATWTAFLIIAFAVVGLIGAFATFAAQIPFDRAVARLHAIDQDASLAITPNPQASLDALRPALDDSADHLFPAAGLAQRAPAERDRVLKDFYAESKDYGLRLRVVIAAFTAAAALFGAMILSIARR